MIYDPGKVSYGQLWTSSGGISTPPTGGQFVDRGPQYRCAIFYHDEEQKRLAEESKRELEKSGRFGKPIVTEILPFTKFYRAEDYHQDYYKKHPLPVQVLPVEFRPRPVPRKGLGEEKNEGRRQPATRNIPSPMTRPCGQKLTPLQYEVTQQEGTEPAFQK